MKDYSNIILLSDMDGTLLDSNSKVSEENRLAIKDFIARGGLFGIATGRTQTNSVLFLEDIEVNIPCILYNGCGLYDFKEKKFIVLHELNKTCVMDYLKYCLNEFKDVVVQVYSPELCHVISSGIEVGTDYIELHKPLELCKLEDIMDKPWIKILFCGKDEDLNALKKLIKEFKLENDINWVFSSEIYLEFLPNQVSKGSALTKLREYMGGNYIIYAVGDFNNDMEMLQAADVGIATQNAIPSLKEIANVITVNNDESAIADIIYHIIPFLPEGILQ